MIAELNRELESLGHREVLESLPVLDGALCEPLGWRAARCFRGMHGEALEGIGRRLEAGRPAARPAEFLALRGRLHWLMGRSQPARGDLEEAVKLEPKNVSARGWLGASWASRRPLAAVVLLRGPLPSEGGGWPALWLAAARLKLPGRAEWAKALKDLRRFLDGGAGGEVPARLLKGLAHLRLEQPRQAWKEADRLIELEPLACAGYGLRSAARWAPGDKAGALADGHLARDRDPNGGFNVADSLLGRAEWADESEHLRLLNEAIEANPREPFLYAERAEVLRGGSLSRFDLALEDYRRAEALAPQRAWLQAQMARAEGQVRGLDKSLERLDRAVALFPEGGWIRAWRGEARRLRGRAREALEDLDAAIARMPWYGYSYAWKGALLAQRGQYAQALSCLDSALAMEPTYPTDVFAEAWRASALLGLGDRQGFRRSLNRACRIDPNHRLVKALAAEAGA